MAKGKPTNKNKEAKTYNHSEEYPLRPDIGTEPQFKKKKQPVTYRYDSSLSPELNWDENPAREQADILIKQILEAEDIETAKVAARKLKALGQPFLNWTGKAERLSFDVPTLPLFVHERLSTRAIIETLKTHKKPGQLSLFELGVIFREEEKVGGQRLNFTIPYFHNGEYHDYHPDFLIRLNTAKSNYFILETKGWDELRDVKKAAAIRWVNAINADGKHGYWQYAMTGLKDVREVIDDAVANVQE